MKIDLILKDVNIPNQESEHWEKLDQKFRDSYQELKNMVEANNDGLFDEDIITIDEKLCKMIYDLHDFDDGIKKPDELINSENEFEKIEYPEVSSDEIKSDIDNINKISENFKNEQNKNEMEENKDEIIEETQQMPSPEDVIKKDTVKTEIETETENIETETETETETEMPKKADEYPEYPEFTEFLKTAETVSAKQLKQFGFPKELWNEDSYEFEYNGYVFRKSVAGLLFNTWIILKNTGL